MSTPQNLVEIVGIGLTEEENELFHAIAVPCHTGPDLDKISSGAENESLEVVWNSYEEKSEENL